MFESFTHRLDLLIVGIIEELFLLHLGEVRRPLEIGISCGMIFLSIGSEVELELRFFPPKRFLAREFGPEHMRLLYGRGEVFIIAWWRFLCLLLCLLLLLFVELSLHTHVVFHFLAFLLLLLSPLLLHLDPQLLLIIHFLVRLPLRLLGIDREESSSKSVIRPD